MQYNTYKPVIELDKLPSGCFEQLIDKLFENKQKAESADLGLLI